MLICVDKIKERSTKMRLSKKGGKLQKHNQFRHAGPRSGISCLYQRLEISLRVQKMSASSAG